MPIIELESCIAVLERMLGRLERLNKRFELGDYDAAMNPNYLVHNHELRSIDLICLDALKRHLPEDSEILKDWFVNQGMDTGLKFSIADCKSKIAKLKIVINLVGSSAGFMAGNTELIVPSPYRKLATSIELLLTDSVMKCTDYSKNVFIMTRFQAGNKTLEVLDSIIRAVLKSHVLFGHRADDRCYPADRNLWDNVCTYMICCNYGIAVLENILVDEFNPNVALEYGFMRALGKPTLLLKEKRFKPRADILGTVWEEFDILDLEPTVTRAINRWIHDCQT